MPEIGARIYVRLSPNHIGYARVRQADGQWRFYYDVEVQTAGFAGLEPNAWRAGALLVSSEGQVWCRDDPEEIAAFKVSEALR